jgi:MoxR-like ATPase
MDVEPLVTLRAKVTEEIGKVVVGQREAIDLMLVALMADGHILLEGVPGVAKTLLARCFAGCLSLQFSRVQFTPDLMPGDVIGANIFNFQTNAFVLTQGPIFTQLLLADEINRTPPKTQAALLEAMQERAVTIDGRSHALGPPFMVIATQNPIEQQGTYPLPEAQLDRFLFKHTLDYPSREDELAIVTRHGSGAAMADPKKLGVTPVIDTAGLLTLGALVDDVRLNDDIVAYIVDLVRATRQQPALQFGASPRAASMLGSSARALAAFEGRDFVIPDDIKRLARPALRHRLVLSPSAEIEGQNIDSVLTQIIERQAAPR